jgi:RNA polymerase sigma factor (TIGR02999 family)
VLLSAASSGDRSAEQELLRRIYGELRGLASAALRPTDRTRLQTTDVVHEAYAKLFRATPVAWESRKHFYRYAAVVIRSLLIDHARAIRAEKRGSLQLHMELTDAVTLVSYSPEEFLIVNNALERLETADPELGQVVALRFFAGLSVGETAEALGCSERTVKRDWLAARVWLQAQLRN